MIDNPLSFYRLQRPRNRIVELVTGLNVEQQRDIPTRRCVPDAVVTDRRPTGPVRCCCSYLYFTIYFHIISMPIDHDLGGSSKEEKEREEGG